MKRFLLWSVIFGLFWLCHDVFGGTIASNRLKASQTLCRTSCINSTGGIAVVLRTTASNNPVSYYYSSDNGATWTEVSNIFGTGSETVTGNPLIAIRNDTFFVAHNYFAAPQRISLLKTTTRLILDTIGATIAGSYNCDPFIGFNHDSLVFGMRSANTAYMTTWSSAPGAYTQATVWTASDSIYDANVIVNTSTQMLNGVAMISRERDLYFADGIEFAAVSGGSNCVPTAIEASTDWTSDNMSILAPRDTSSLFFFVYEVADSVNFLKGKIVDNLNETWTYTALDTTYGLVSKGAHAPISAASWASLEPRLSMSSDNKKLFLFYKQWPDSTSKDTVSICWKVSSDSGTTWSAESTMTTLYDDTVRFFRTPENLYSDGSKVILFGNWEGKGATEKCATDTLIFSCTNPIAPTLTSPVDGDTGKTNVVTLDWDDVAEVDTYQVQLDDDSLFGSTLSDTKVTASTTTCPTLSASTYYFWRVKGIDSTCYGTYATKFRFKMAAPGAPVIYTATKRTVRK